MLKEAFAAGAGSGSSPTALLRSDFDLHQHIENEVVTVLHFLELGGDAVLQRRHVRFSDVFVCDSEVERSNSGGITFVHPANLPFDIEKPPRAAPAITKIICKSGLVYQAS